MQGVRAQSAASPLAGLPWPSGSQVDVWMLGLSGADDPQAPLSWLSAAERARRRRFVNEEDGRRYAFAHAALRWVLGRYLGLSSHLVPIGRLPCHGCGGGHGRPVLDDPYADLSFSLSYRGEVILVAVAAEQVGVDVDRAADEFHDAIVDVAASPRERAELLEISAGPQRIHAATELWTAKEAHLKALGTGLMLPPDHVVIDPTDSGAFTSGLADEETRWAGCHLQIGFGYSGAVVLASTEVALRLRDLGRDLWEAPPAVGLS